MPKILRYIYVVLAITSILFISLIFITLFSKLQIPNQTLIVSPGDTLGTISNKLNQRKLLKYPFVLKLYGAISFKEKNIKSGEYLINDEKNVYQLLDDMVNGDIYYRNFRIKEGSRFNELILKIRNAEMLVDDLSDNPESFLRNKFNILFPYMEGLFAPETYFYKSGDLVSDILGRAYKAQMSHLKTAWSGRSIGLPYKDKYELLILASIVEKEGNEKLKIASVFLRRLLLGMKLQTDPTVIFAMGIAYNGNIKRKDLLMEHPYNTYFINGLPPGPISFPSKSSIATSSFLDDQSYLYFVAKGDGTHYFSSSYEEHIQAVKKYQLKLK